PRHCRPRLEALEPRTVLSTFLVSTLDDHGAGSLRQAVLDADANPGIDVIRFRPGLTGACNLTTGELDITTAVHIEGPGAGQLTVSAGGLSRIFGVFGTSAHIDGLTIAGGAAELGGGILNLGSSLDLIHVRCMGNVAAGDSGLGGAVFNTGAGAALRVESSQFLDNQARGNILAAGGGLPHDLRRLLPGFGNGVARQVAA